MKTLTSFSLLRRRSLGRGSRNQCVCNYPSDFPRISTQDVALYGFKVNCIFTSIKEGSTATGVFFFMVCAIKLDLLRILRTNILEVWNRPRMKIKGLALAPLGLPYAGALTMPILSFLVDRILSCAPRYTYVWFSKPWFHDFLHKNQGKTRWEIWKI
jgi:hypothetical protein